MEQEIDAQIEQLLSAKRTVRNIDAASAANVIGEYFEQCTNFTESMPRLSSSCQPSALSDISMPRPLPMLLVSILQCTKHTESMPRLSSSCQPSALSEIFGAASAAIVIVEYFEQCTNYTESMPRLSSSGQPSALSEILMPHLLPMLLVSISNSAQITLNRCSD